MIRQTQIDDVWKKLNKLNPCFSLDYRVHTKNPVAEVGKEAARKKLEQLLEDELPALRMDGQILLYETGKRILVLSPVQMALYLDLYDIAEKLISKGFGLSSFGKNMRSLDDFILKLQTAEEALKTFGIFPPMEGAKEDGYTFSGIAWEVGPADIVFSRKGLPDSLSLRMYASFPGISKDITTVLLTEIVGKIDMDRVMHHLTLWKDETAIRNVTRYCAYIQYDVSETTGSYLFQNDTFGQVRQKLKLQLLMAEYLKKEQKEEELSRFLTSISLASTVAEPGAVSDPQKAARYAKLVKLTLSQRKKLMQMAKGRKEENLLAMKMKQEAASIQVALDYLDPYRKQLDRTVMCLEDALMDYVNLGTISRCKKGEIQTLFCNVMQDISRLSSEDYLDLGMVLMKMIAGDQEKMQLNGRMLQVLNKMLLPIVNAAQGRNGSMESILGISPKMIPLNQKINSMARAIAVLQWEPLPESASEGVKRSYKKLLSSFLSIGKEELFQASVDAGLVEASGMQDLITEAVKRGQGSIVPYLVYLRECRK